MTVFRTQVSTATYSSSGLTISKPTGEIGQPSEGGTPGDTPQSIPSASEMPPMIGDFNDNANALWSLHLDEAKSHDEARIHSLKEDMDSVLIFVRVVSLSSFFSELIMLCRLGRFILRCPHFLSYR